MFKGYAVDSIYSWLISSLKQEIISRNKKQNNWYWLIIIISKSKFNQSGV